MQTNESTARLYVVASEPAFVSQAQALAERLGLPLGTFEQQDKRHGDIGSWCLQVGADGLSMQQIGPGAPGPVRVDFVGGKMGFRRQRQEATPDLVKAVGIKPGIRPLIWDLTAGLGQDAFILARQGCVVRMFERHPIVHALLADGLERARAAAAEGDEELGAILQRMTLLAVDSHEILAAPALPQGMGEKPQVIYIDTMFPERSKSAKVKKEMQLFQHLVGNDSDADQLLASALSAEPHRVVVKRPRHAPQLAGLAPSVEFKGKSVRFDVYALRRLDPS